MSAGSSAPRHRAKRSLSIRAVLTVASALAGTTLVVSAAAGGTYAMWSGTTTFNGPIIQSGSLALLINGQATSALTSTQWARMLPGDKTRLQVTVANTGTVNSTVTAGSTGGSTDIEVRVVKGTCPVIALTGNNTLLTPAALGTWSAGESSAACVEVTMKSAASAAAQNASLPFTLTLTATQAP